MSHMQIKCEGCCLTRLAATLDLQAPAGDVPHGDVQLQCVESEAFFALAARVSPKVIEACRCPKKVKHPADIIYVGHRLKLRRWDEKETKCGCPIFIYQWEDSISRCMWDAYMCWSDMVEEFNAFIDESVTALSDGEGASQQHQKKRLFEREYM
ncbi:hypothetical protein V5O48_018433 [Marasmius crinis-equi]|uniref:Uncharacterized protein n=1 Tax=Marasmius crinis-equi TaxID=585013 RepID=A0ABR3EL66_9AGAR